MKLSSGLMMIGLMVLVVGLYPDACVARQGRQRQCTYSCGNIHNIRKPFRLKGDPPECGDKRYELDCVNNRTILYLQPGKYYVQEISYSSETLRVVDASIDKDDYCSFPLYSLMPMNFYFNSSNPFYLYYDNSQIVFLNCTKPQNSYVDIMAACNNSSTTKTNFYYYALSGDLPASEFPKHCRIQLTVPVLLSNITTFFDIHHHLLMGFKLVWVWEPPVFYYYFDDLSRWHKFLLHIEGLYPDACLAKQCMSSCGNIHNISKPFRLKGDPHACGDKRYELDCVNNRTILYLQPGKYYVQEISYSSETLRVVDASIDKDDYCSFPLYSLMPMNFYFNSSNPFYLYYDNSQIVFLNCTKPQNSYVDIMAACNNSSTTKTNFYYYALSEDLPASEFPKHCRIQLSVPVLLLNITTFFDIHHHLLMGFKLHWKPPGSCSTMPWPQELLYNLEGASQLVIMSKVAAFFVAKTLVGIICMITFLIHKFRQRHLSSDDAIEGFLRSHNNFMPSRYSYSEIKEITKSFKDKLGEGGFGSVYKGKLQNGRFVAVKVLSRLKANGQDFISEVATVGRICHVNVVQLAGFCVEGSKRALIYDFMANGSLDKFIFQRGENTDPLSWETTYEVALGVARGIEYLHRGCEMQILHFDIKPHNILLNQNFVPKISDFGLAKLYPIDDSIVSLTAVRGTQGYIAPEMFYNNIGGVSYKADVYSFGMLLMEMVGRRKNLNVHVDQSSQIYFPSWIYNRINGGEEIELGDDVNEDDKTIARKMIIIALWCIQLKPADRPSMGKVLEMFESKFELLQMPPKPFLCPQDMSSNEVDVDNNPARVQHSSNKDLNTITVELE